MNNNSSLSGYCVSALYLKLIAQFKFVEVVIFQYITVEFYHSKGVLWDTQL